MRLADLVRLVCLLGLVTHRRLRMLRRMLLRMLSRLRVMMRSMQLGRTGCACLVLRV
jgi:hypothetical protein